MSLICAATLCATAWVGAPAALASHGETVFFEAPRDLLGVSPATRARTIAKLSSLGVKALRIVLYWRTVAPKPNAIHRPRLDQASPATYHWGAYDPLIAAAGALHWTILLTVSGPVPRWASAHGRDHLTDPSTADFRLFTEAVGRHYGSRVKLFSIWNEPNEPSFLKPQYVRGKLASALLYRSLFLAGYAGLKASGHFAGMKVLMGETSPVGVRDRQIPAPLAFMRGVLCLNASYRPVGRCSMLPADGYAEHPYSEAQGPFWIPPADDVTIGVIGRLVTALDRAAASRAVRPGLPVYITEFGVQSYPNYTQGVTPAQQPEFDALDEQIAWNNPRVASFSQYLLRDDHPNGASIVGFQSGLETSAGIPKPSYGGFRLPLAVTRTASGVSFWGLVRPARRATSIVVQYSADGGRHWHGLTRVRTDSSGAWSAGGRFVRGRRWRVRWTSAAGAVFTGAPTRAYTSSGQIGY